MLKPKRLRSLLLSLLTVTVLTCDTGERPADTGSRAFAETSIHLAAPGQWRQLNASGTFMTTPRWLPDESGVIASGYLGVGLFFLAPDSLEAQVIDPGFSGLVTFEGGGRLMCLRPSGDGGVTAYDLKQKKAAADGAVCAPQDGSTDRVLFEGGGVRIVQDLVHGTLIRADGGGETVIEEAAWSAAPSPDGSHVAYCTGHLTDPSLFVFGGAGEGKRTAVGKGAHPAWLPGGQFLVYARPEADGTGRVVRSELHLFDVKEGLSVRLTGTPGIVEMQPVISPDGKKVAFSDWKSGAVMVAPLEEAAP
jgi:Tol biopolymer transport system component